MKLEAEWKDDCQGKKDYDANLVRLSSRYWPRGGGFHTYDSDTREWCGNESRPEIKPSAHASILLGPYTGDVDDTGVTLAEAEFEAETEAEVKQQVEQWAQDQFERIVIALRAFYLELQR